MNIDVRRLNPRNWLSNDEERGGCSNALSCTPLASFFPSLYAGSSLWGMHAEADRFFSDALHRLNAESAVLTPSIDIQERDKEYQISVEVPGVDEKDIHLELVENALTVSGEKKAEKSEDGNGRQYVERSYGSFRRVLTLPEDVDRQGIDARFKNGVLTVTMPRKKLPKPEEKSHMIEIKRSS